MPRKALRIEAGPGLAPGLDRRFVAAFRIGRGDGCEIRLRSPMCSREHARMEPRGETWWVTDLGAANGLFVDENEVREAPLAEGSLVRLGRGGPVLKVSFVSEEEFDENDLEPVAPAPAMDPSPSQVRDPSLTGVMQRYFGSTDEGAGDHTRMVRQAYSVVRGRERRWFYKAIGAVAVLLLVALR